MTVVNSETSVLPNTASAPFVDRRKGSGNDGGAQRERRQFANSYNELSEPARELAHAIDQYKLSNRRRFITYEEMYEVISQLGYRRDTD
ncbi:MAG: hypothetical protein KDB14_08775 [Planctomycetales bacterium]|nr:hypothetical protein [Planctomycetales bacterium]